MKNPKRPSKNRFATAPQVGIQRSTFDLSYPYKTTFSSGFLIPLPPEEVLPGDSFKYRMTSLCRIATPLHPTMDNLWLESFFFFVPNRLTWTNFQRFMGEQDNPADSTDYLIPQTGSYTWTQCSVGDHMGLPTGIDLQVNALPLRAMNLCVKEWFRDENLQNSPTINTDDGPDTGVGSTYVLQRRGKRKDYISSALPWPQKGPGVEIPIGVRADVKGIGVLDGTSPFTLGPLQVFETGDVPPSNTTYALSDAADLTQFRVQEHQTNAGTPNIYADLTTATGATINDWREAFQMQKLQERDARGGTRYTEILKSHFMVVSPDQRLQRPEYLGGGRSAVQMNVIPQTSSTNATTPQGNLAAMGVATVQGHGFTKSFVEHGWIIGFINVRADLNYQQRLDKKWSRQTKYDYYWPALQALGEQAVLNKEVYANGTANDDLVWGYQERWAEYRQNLGVITGAFRSNAAAPLDAWHYALDFGATPPTLSDTFIQDNPPVSRTIAVQSEPEFLFDAWIDIKAARPMPVYSVPGYIDHF